MNCQTTHELFSEYFDGGLRPEERRALEEHLQACPDCTTEFRHYTESLTALQKTGPVQTTQLFLSTVRAAAAGYLNRRENLLRMGDSQGLTVVTPKADPLLEPAPGATSAQKAPRIAVPAWMPWALAAGVLVAFLLGLGVPRGERPEEVEARVRKVVEQEFAKRPPRVIVEREQVDLDKLMQARGLVKAADGQWIPQVMDEDFKAGMVYLRGRRMSRENAARELLKEFPPEAPPLPPPVAVPTAEEILSKARYRNVNGTWVPEAWAARWESGSDEVLVRANEWKKAEEFTEAFIRDNGLVRVGARWMTREQAELLQSQQAVKMPDAAVAINEVTRALDGLTIGPPMNHRGITVYPLLAAEAPKAASYLPLHAAEGSGKLELREDRLFNIEVENRLDSDVLLLAGEILTGGRCARVVSEDTLVPKGQTARARVFCVEPGAWRLGDRFAKESGHYVAPPSIRRALVWDQGQGAVWALLARRLDKSRAGQVDLFRKHAEALADYRGFFTVMPDREPLAVGMVVALGDSIEFAEIFQDHDLLNGYFDRLVVGAAVDLLERAGEPAAARAAPAFPNSVKGVKQFLENAFFWTYEAREDGYGVRKDEGWVGRARVAGGALSHAVFFAPGAPEWDRKTAYAVPRDKVQKALADFETRLKNAGPARKVAVLHDLASINSPDVTGALLRHLGETDAPVRRAVVQELGLCGDPRATDPLLQLLARSRQDLPLFAEIVRSLGRLGDERAVDPLLKAVDAGEIEPAKILIQGLPELLLAVRTREVLERATQRLVVFYESAEGAIRGEVNPLGQNVRPAEAQALAEALRAALRDLVGLEFSSSAGARKWWNDRDQRERFLKERTTR
jgi:hypothetical protein